MSDKPANHPRIWEILRAIEREDEGDGVVPIVGQGLLRVNSLGAPSSTIGKKAGIPDHVVKAARATLEEITEPEQLNVLMARSLSHGLGNGAVSSKATFFEAVSQHPSIDSNRYMTDTEVLQHYLALQPEVPLALRRLARIESLNLFVTTTPDDLLERALNEERFASRPLTKVISYSPTRRPQDKDIEIALNSGFPVVFHLFGRYKSPGFVALTESDFVDYMAALLDRESRPNRLFSELRGKHLLLLGSSFQDWLARFFLRLTRDAPFIDQSGGVQYVADEELSRDKSLALFFKRSAKKAESIDDVDPGDFVVQLAERWVNRDDPQEDKEEAKVESVASDSVFISYSRSDLAGNASKDVERATRLAEDLRSKGWDVWLDTFGGLKCGDDYAERIRLAIGRCGLFIPICSSVTQMRPDVAEEAERPFFRKEWAAAIERAESLKQEDSERRFILPVVVDDLPFSHSNVPPYFKHLHAIPLSGGAATPDFLAEVKGLIRRIRSQEHNGQ